MKKANANNQLEKNLIYCEKIHDYCSKIDKNIINANITNTENFDDKNEENSLNNINKKQYIKESSINSILTNLKNKAKEIFIKTSSSKNIKNCTPKNIDLTFTETSSTIVFLTELILKDDNSFYISFLKTFPDFSPTLLKLNPTLKSSDIEFCALIKLNFETKQIAQYKKISVRAVEGKKYRIRKKLNISTDENMYIWMADI